MIVPPDARRSVFQLRIPRMLLYAVPLSIAIVVAVLVTLSITSHQQQQITMLENNKLSAQLTAYIEQSERTVSEKDETIEKLHHFLQNDLLKLSNQADEMLIKVAELELLEDELRSISMIETPISDDRKLLVQIASARGEDGGADDMGAHGMGGMTFSLHEGEDGMTTLRDYDAGDEDDAMLPHANWGSESIYDVIARSTESTFDQLYEELDHLLASLSEAKQAIIEHQEYLRVTPSIWPTTSTRITSHYGIRKDPFTGRSGFHAGLDIGGKVNDPIYATADGVVRTAGYDRTNGNHIVIQHENGIRTLYLHMNKLQVKVGDTVEKGDKIGTLGNSGRSTGAHLHYEVHVNGKAVNPLPYTRAPENKK